MYLHGLIVQSQSHSAQPSLLGERGAEGGRVEGDENRPATARKRVYKKTSPPPLDQFPVRVCKCPLCL